MGVRLSKKKLDHIRSMFDGASSSDMHGRELLSHIKAMQEEVEVLQRELQRSKKSAADEIDALQCVLRRQMDLHLNELDNGFPIQPSREVKVSPHPMQVPWHIAQLAYNQYYAENWEAPQSLKAIAERGGFGSQEMDTYLPDWRERCENERLRREGVSEDAKVGAIVRELASNSSVIIACDSTEACVYTIRGGHQHGRNLLVALRAALCAEVRI